MNSSAQDWFGFLGLRLPIKCIDVGASNLGDGGEEPEHWVRWAQEGCADVLGFEPVCAECDRLNNEAVERGIQCRYLPWALGDGYEHTLYLTNFPMTSSLFPPARNTLDLFPALGVLTQVVEELPMQTQRLDDIKEAADADFLKLDVQGAELMILQNAKQCLKSVSVIQCEVEFVELYEGQPLMADVDAFLRSHGFCFLRFVYVEGRSFKPLEVANKPYAAMSQMLWADAIYVRDFRRLPTWSLRQIRTAAFILHDAYSAYDLTLFLLRELDLREGCDLASCYVTALMLCHNGEIDVSR